MLTRHRSSYTLLSTFILSHILYLIHCTPCSPLHLLLVLAISVLPNALHSLSPSFLWPLVLCPAYLHLSHSAISSHSLCSPLASNRNPLTKTKKLYKIRKKDCSSHLCCRIKPSIACVKLGATAMETSTSQGGVRDTVKRCAGGGR